MWPMMHPITAVRASLGGKRNCYCEIASQDTSEYIDGRAYFVAVVYLLFLIVPCTLQVCHTLIA